MTYADRLGDIFMPWHAENAPQLVVSQVSAGPRPGINEKKSSQTI